MTSTPKWNLVVAALMVVIVGCDDEPDEEEPVEPVADYEAVEGLDEDDPGDEVQEVEVVTPEDDPRREIADEADQMLRQRLMGRVMEVVEEEGAAAAVDVCHEVAIPMTEEIGQEYDVDIGRVSDRLRNPDNTAGDWVWSMIEEADDEPHYASNDTFQAVKPVEVAQPCTNCHGDTDELAEGVPEAIDAHYPDDEATGYDVGDVRGWVWVEVPDAVGDDQSDNQPAR